MSSKCLMLELVLQGGGVCLVFSCVSPIVLIIGFKIYAPPCQVLYTGVFIVLSPNLLDHVALLNLMLTSPFSVFRLQVALVWFDVTS